eukprot:15106982-Alexandrium_andersonii.AAC.1
MSSLLAELLASRNSSATQKTAARPNVQLPEGPSSSSAGNVPLPKTSPTPNVPGVQQAQYMAMGRD